MRSRASLGWFASATAALLLIGSEGAAIEPSRWRRAVAASRYIAVNQKTDGSFKQSLSPVGTAADAVLSLVAVRRAPDEIDDALEFIAANIAETDANLGLKAKVTMAVAAGGLDPRSFAGRDLVDEIRDTLQPDGQFGAHTATPGDAEVLNHALAILALVAGGEGLLPESAINWLLAGQCDDGGWQYDDAASEAEDAHCNSGPGDFSETDTNTTAYAVQALRAAQDSRLPEQNPLLYFGEVRDPAKGGWGYDRTFNLTDANSTALVIQAFAALGEPLPSGAMEALKRLQFRLCGPRSGAFAFTFERRDGGGFRRTEPNVPATIGAVLGLRQLPLPVAPRAVTKQAPGAKRCD